jgi:hypothetical protein
MLVFGLMNFFFNKWFNDFKKWEDEYKRKCEVYFEMTYHYNVYLRLTQPCSMVLNFMSFNKCVSSFKSKFKWRGDANILIFKNNYIKIISYFLTDWFILSIFV